MNRRCKCCDPSGEKAVNIDELLDDETVCECPYWVIWCAERHLAELQTCVPVSKSRGATSRAVTENEKYVRAEIVKARLELWKRREWLLDGKHRETYGIRASIPDTVAKLALRYLEQALVNMFAIQRSQPPGLSHIPGTTSSAGKALNQYKSMPSINDITSSGASDPAFVREDTSRTRRSTTRGQRPPETEG